MSRIQAARDARELIRKQAEELYIRGMIPLGGENTIDVYYALNRLTLSRN